MIGVESDLSGVRRALERPDNMLRDDVWLSRYNEDDYLLALEQNTTLAFRLVEALENVIEAMHLPNERARVCAAIDKALD